jgi:hypothetical protein
MMTNITRGEAVYNFLISHIAFFCSSIDICVILCHNIDAEESNGNYKTYG